MSITVDNKAIVTSIGACCQPDTEKKYHMIKGVDLTERGAKIKAELAEYALNNVWLRQQLSQSGINVHGTVLCGILNGYRQGPQAVKVLDACEYILRKYTSAMGRIETGTQNGTR